MTISQYDLVRNMAKDRGIDLQFNEELRIIGTLKMAGFPKEIDEDEIKVATAVVANKLREIPPRIAATKDSKVVTANVDQSRFQKIDAYMKEGKCTRCGSPMTKVKLSDYDKANYCTECRVTLW